MATMTMRKMLAMAEREGLLIDTGAETLSAEGLEDAIRDNDNAETMRALFPRSDDPECFDAEAVLANEVYVQERPDADLHRWGTVHNIGVGGFVWPTPMYTLRTK